MNIEQPCQIIWWPVALEQLNLFEKQARQMRIFEEYSHALEELRICLIMQPQGFGDIHFKYDNIHAEVRHGILPNWFSVTYGYDWKARVVAIRNLTTAPGSCLF